MNTPHSPSIPEKLGFWRRFLFRGILIGGIGLILLLAFLIVITVPNLRREVAPPEISGPEQAERNRNASPSSTAPTSGTLSGTASDSTSGTHPILNLDDYPHLSPKMRELAQAWLDQCAKTDKALETITDPVLRAQFLEFLKKCRKNIQVFLNEPLKWDKYTGRDGAGYVGHKWDKFPYYSSPNAISSIKNGDDWMQFKKAHPEFSRAFAEESFGMDPLFERMEFEFAVYNHRWNVASYTCAMNDFYPLTHPNSWEEELYCIRQMGVPGWACLAGRSYQHALDSQRQGQVPSSGFQSYLRFAGHLPIIVIYNKSKAQEDKSQAKKPD
jgi:hypothetical protein